MFKSKRCLAALLLLVTATSCESVKAYQRQYLKDDAMQQGASSIEKSENEAFSYREGASGGDFGKTGGGCGCN